MKKFFRKQNIQIIFRWLKFCIRALIVCFTDTSSSKQTNTSEEADHRKEEIK